MPREVIELADTSATPPDALPRAIAAAAPRFSFYRFAHEHGGRRLAPVVFVYTCPGAARVRERMLYASSRAHVLAVAGEQAGLAVDKKVGWKRKEKREREEQLAQKKNFTFPPPWSFL